MREQIIQILRQEIEWVGDFFIPPELPLMQNGYGKTQYKTIKNLELINDAILNCRACGLSNPKKRLASEKGNLQAKLMFISDTPGTLEDETGAPFSGSAGNLLADIIEKAMGINRAEVFVTTVLKCSLNHDRTPLPDEIEKCMKFLHEQILAVRPEVIVTLGSLATNALLNNTAPISELRGEFTDFNGARLMPTYHPKYLLLNPSKKRQTWEDIKKVMEVLGIRPQR